MSQTITTKNPIFKDLREQDFFSANTSGRATMSGILNKTTASLLALIALSAVFYTVIPVNLLMTIGIVAGLATVVVTFIAAARHKLGFGAVAIYVPLEALFLGAISKAFDMQWPGIASSALLATMVTAFVVFLVYRSKAIRVSPGFMKVVGIATLSLAVLYLVNLVLVLCGINIGVANAGAHAGMLSYAVSAIAMVLALANLLIDFNTAEQVVEQGAPVEQEWHVAFAFMTTLAWMYVEILRIMSYARN